MTQFETERLILTLISPEHAGFYCQLMNTPKWYQYIGDRHIYDALTCEKYIQDRFLPQIERLGYGNFVVSLKDTNEQVGCCGLFTRDGLDVTDLGFAFLPQFEKKGYAFESCKLVLELAQKDYKLKTLSAITDQNNIDCQRLLEKLSFENKGTKILPGETKEVMYYELNL